MQILWKQKALKRKLIAVAETLAWFNFNDD